MKISIWQIIKIELMKFLRRRDIFAVFAIVAMTFIYAIGMRDESFKGTENQNALLWLVVQLLTSTVLFIGPVVCAFIGTQMLSSEIDNGSISLFTVRVRNRKKLYLAKSISLIIISVIFFLFTVLVLLGVYAWIVSSGSKFVSGTLTGNNVGALLGMGFMVFLFTYFLMPQFALFVGIKLKPLMAIVAAFGLTVICNHVLTYTFIKYVNPMSYIYTLAYDVLETTDVVVMEPGFVLKTVMGQVFVSIIYFVLLTVKGMKSFDRKEF